MSSPRDLRLDRLDDRDGLRPAPLGEVARVATQQTGTSALHLRAAYEALIDAVFLAPGASEWLLGLRRALAARLAEKDAAPREAVPRDAIRKAGPGRD